MIDDSKKKSRAEDTDNVSGLTDGQTSNWQMDAVRNRRTTKVPISSTADEVLEHDLH